MFAILKVMRKFFSFLVHALALSFTALFLSWMFDGSFYSYQFTRAQGLDSPPIKENHIDIPLAFPNFGSFIKGTNILLLGMAGKPYPAPELTDTIMIASFEGDPLRLTLTSIPRDLLVSVGAQKRMVKINSLYELGLTFSPLLPTAFIVEKVEEITGRHIDYFVGIDVLGLEQIIDRMGGVDIEVKKDIADPFFPGPNYSYEPLYIKKGFGHFSGHDAVRLVRSRYSVRGDFDRIERQHDLLEAIRIRAKDTLKNPNALLDIFSGLKEYFSTNVTLKDIPLFLGALLSGHIPIEATTIDPGQSGLLSEIHTQGGMYGLIPKAGIDDYSEIQNFFQRL